jgi:hypothetical protein
MTKTEISEVLSVYPLYLVQCTSLDWFPEGEEEKGILPWNEKNFWDYYLFLK